ncbi:MAG: hypothetical protein ACK47B_03320 [Armatimonadota bacterium]
MPDVLRLEVVHAVPGRLRARCPGLRADERRPAELERLAAGLPGLERIEVRPSTESVVFHYALEETTPEAFRNALAQRCLLVDRTDEPTAMAPPDAGAPVPVGGLMIRGVKRQWRQADRAVYRATGGALDLRTTVPWVLLFLAIRQIATSQYLPALPWYTALYYSLQAITRYPDGDQEALPESAGPAEGAD